MHTPKIGRSKKAKQIKDILESVNMPEHVDTAHTILGNRILFVSILPDSDQPNPCDEMDGFGMMHSLSNRHFNHITMEHAQSILEENKDAVRLSYFEHGNCLWMVSDAPTPPGVEFQWDGVRFAGLWVPDKCLLDEVDGLTTEARHTRMQQFATQACETYSQWCNGEIYGYSVSLYKLRKDTQGEPYEKEDDYRRDKAIEEDSCFGFFGYDCVQQEVKALIKNILADNAKLKSTNEVSK